MKQILIIIFTLTIINANATIALKNIASDTTQVVDNNTLYEISNDSDYIYFNLSTADKKTMMSFLQSGITVYFDIKGKEKKDVYIKHLLKINRNNQIHKNDKSLDESNKSNMPDLNSIIVNLPKEVEYGFFKDIQQFHKSLNSLDISLNWTYSSEKELLEFNLKIPKHKVSTKENIDFSKLSIGVVSNKIERTISQEKKRSQGSGQGGRGSGRGSGMRGGSMKRGGNQSQSNSHNSTTTTTIDFWFDANLKK